MSKIELDKLNLSKLSKAKEEALKQGKKKENAPGKPAATPVSPSPKTDSKIKPSAPEDTALPAAESPGKSKFFPIIISIAALLVILGGIAWFSGLITLPFDITNPYDEIVDFHSPRGIKITTYRLNDTIINLTAHNKSLSSDAKLRAGLDQIERSMKYLNDWEKVLANFTSGSMRLDSEDQKYKKEVTAIKKFYSGSTIDAYRKNIDGYLTSCRELLTFCHQNYKKIRNGNGSARRAYDHFYIKYSKALKKYKFSTLRLMEKFKEVNNSHPALADYAPYTQKHYDFWENYKIVSPISSIQ